MSHEQPLQSEKELPDARARVFLDELPWDIRSRNTDWRYVRFSLPLLMQYESSLYFTMQSSRWITARENIRTVRNTLGRRLGLLPKREELTSTLSETDLARSKSDLVFAHRAFPTNAGGAPVIWQNCILDPQMQLSYGATQADLDSETAAKAKLYRQAARVQVSTEAEARRLGEMFPDIADRFAPVPFFTPHVVACAAGALRKHLEEGAVRILFVGNQAWRKGLDLLLQAFVGLPQPVLAQAQLTVISNFVPPAVPVPGHTKIKVLRGVDSARVLQEMSQAHIFVNVARFESYGLVFHEAMSQGLACLAPDWEVQRELFDYGAAGTLLSPDAHAIGTALEGLITDPQRRYDLGVAAWQRYQERYAPAIVAKKYAKLFRVVAGR